LKKQENIDAQTGSGLFLGSEPMGGVYDRRASSRGDDDSKDGGLGDKGDDDTSDKRDSDSTDKGDGKDDSRDSDGRD
jgi:hypothetical protein